MRVLSGRLKAVLVASLATIVLIGILAPATTLASDPPGLARFMAAIGQVESGGNYYARNATSGAYGKYQIMPSSWRTWADRYLGDPNAKPTPANQELVAAAKFRALYNWLGSWRRVAYSWLTGSSQTSGWSYSATRYVNRVMATYNASTTATLAAPAAATALRYYSEKSTAIAYAGSWATASHARYAGGAATYATEAGSTATFTFTGTKVIWYGPVGPTRGQARVLVDGVYVKTVNLNSSTFAAHRAVYSRGWGTAGRHTVEIDVVGTAGHPYVAIDQFVVAN
ncbi:MAG: transglycosylase family protein [Chloroflexota bacterium]